MSCRFLVVAFLFLFCSNALSAEVELVDTSGQFKIRCEVIRVVGDKVEVRKSNGMLLTVKLKDLNRRSVEAIVKDLGSRIPPSKVITQRPMLTGQAQVDANRTALTEMRKYLTDLKIKPVQNAPFGAIRVEIGTYIGDVYVEPSMALMQLDALKHLSDVTDLSMLDTLELTLGSGEYQITKDQVSYVNLLTETKTLNVKVPKQYENDLTVGAVRSQPRDLRFFKYINLTNCELLYVSGDFHITTELLETVSKRFPNLVELRLQPNRLEDPQLETKYFELWQDKYIAPILMKQSLRKFTFGQQQLSTIACTALKSWAQDNKHVLDIYLTVPLKSTDSQAFEKLNNVRVTVVE